MSSENDAERFLTVIENTKDFNLPQVAESLGYEWADIKQVIFTDAAMKQRLANVLDAIRYEILGEILNRGRKGKGHNERDIEIGYAKQAIALIDSGAFLGSKIGVEGGPPPAVDAALLEALGLKKKGE